MKRFLIFFLVALMVVPAFSQKAKPPFTDYNIQKMYEYIVGGYITITRPTLTTPTFSGTVTNSAINYNTGLWYWAKDGDTLKVNVYKGDYFLDFELGNTRKFAIDSTGIVVGANAEKIDNATDGTWQFTAGVLKHSYDTAAYWTATQSDGGAVTFNSVSDGTPGFVFSDPVEINGAITLENDEIIDNGTNGTIQLTTNIFKQSYDAAAYWTATQADGGAVTLNSVSDGTAGFIFSDPVEINGLITLANDELIDNSMDGTIEITANIIKQTYDAAAYWTATQSDGGGVTFNSVSDGTPGFVFSDPVEINGAVTFANDEIIDNSVDGTVAITAGVVKHAYDINAYWTATQADGGGVTFNSTSDGTAGFTFSDNITLDDGSVLAIDHGATFVVDDQVSTTNYQGTTNTTIIYFTADVISITDAGANGAHGSKKILDFPQGAIKIVGVVSDIAVTCGTSGLAADATYDYGLGSAAVGVDNEELAGTEQDILNKVEGDLVTSAADWNGYTGTDLTLNGTSSAGDCYLNVAFTATDCSANDEATITGQIRITWINLGDY